MENSKIYDLLESKLLQKWKEDVELAEGCSWFFTNEQEALEELKSALTVQERELLKSYSLALENKLDYIYYNIKIKTLNFGIKIGMELAKSFADFEEDA